MAEALRKQAHFASHVAFANTGSEANELLIKVARRFGAPNGRHEILCFHGAFHGRTFGALSASGQLKMHKGFEPLLPGFKHVPYNDLEAARNAVNRHSAAILVEPIQGENGVVLGTDEFLVGLRRLADRQGLLLMLDEIQTGLGRTGLGFAFEHLGQDCVPDVMSLAKSLGGGLPLSAVLIGDRATKAIGLGEHGTTMGGNPVACAAGLALLKELHAKKLVANAAKQGAFLMEVAQGPPGRPPAPDPLGARPRPDDRPASQPAQPALRAFLPAAGAHRERHGRHGAAPAAALEFDGGGGQAGPGRAEESL